MSLSNIKQKAAEAKAAAAANATTDAATTPNAVEVVDYSFLKIEVNKYEEFRSVQILQTGFVALLQSLGFRRYDKQDGSFIVVRLQDNILEEMTVPNLRLAAVRYFAGIDEDDLFDRTRCPKGEMMEKLYRSLGTLLSEEKLSLLVDLDRGNEFKICADTKDCGYYFYENGFVEVSREHGVRLRPYSELPGIVWKDQILPRRFEKMEAEQYETAYFYKFLQNVAYTKGKDDDTNATRLAALMSIAGYNLHRFFDTHLRATVLLDARTSDEPDGRSGKSLFCKALRFIMNAQPDTGAQCRIIDGKTFDQDNRFKYEELAHTTRLVIFDDIKRGVSIEDFFNAIPDGLAVERKSIGGKERVHAKILFTLNYTLSIRGGSAKDRVIEFEFADYYSSKFKPEAEFKHWFFRDWDTNEWNKFDNLLMACVDLFMRLGVVSAAPVNLMERKLKDETCAEFVTFMEDTQPEHARKYNRKEWYTKLVDLDSDGKARNKDLAWMKMRAFTEFLKRWAEYRPEVAGYKMHRSNSVDYITFFYNQPASAEALEGAVLFPEKSGNCTPTDAPVVSEKLPF